MAKSAEQWQEIKKAVESGRVTKKYLDPTTKGSYLGKCLAGKNAPRGAMLDFWYSRLTTLKKLDSNLDSAAIQKDAVTNENEEIIAVLRKEIAELKAENKRLSEILDSGMGKLDSKLDSGTIQKLDSNLDSSTIQSGIPAGWYLVQRSPASGAKSYWYAGKQVNGKQIWVYVGREKTRAADKVEAWLAVRGNKP